MKTVDVLLPQSGMGMQDGEILEWRKKEGDAISEGEILVEIEAAKVVVEVPSPCTGIVTSILASEGDIVEVRAVIAKIQSE